MKNISNNSIFNIKIDFEKSKGSRLYDSNTDKIFLDFFNNYSSVPLGYNDEIFDESYEKIIKKISKFKISNCEFITDEAIEFDKKFTSFETNKLFQCFHYCCTGALAVEAAIKTASLYKKHKQPNIICFSNSFHGINSYGGFLTSKTNHFSKRLENFPEVFTTRLNTSILQEDLEKIVFNNDITAILVEPIQCSAGDIFLNKNFFSIVEKISKKYDIPLIFDEIQTGFGTTGKLWFFEHLNIMPDIVVFGKKAQTSGIMAIKKFEEIFEKSYMLEPTWTGDLLDMVRCSFIIDGYKKYNIFHNVNFLSNFFETKLKEYSYLNFKKIGFLMSFTLKTEEERNDITKYLLKNGILCNPTGDYSIRLRPNLKLSLEDSNEFIEKILNFRRKTWLILK